jgi:hypothetical protein
MTPDPTGRLRYLGLDPFPRPLKHRLRDVDVKVMATVWRHVHVIDRVAARTHCDSLPGVPSKHVIIGRGHLAVPKGDCQSDASHHTTITDFPDANGGRLGGRPQLEEIKTMIELTGRQLEEFNSIAPWEVPEVDFRIAAIEERVGLTGRTVLELGSHEHEG